MDNSDVPPPPESPGRTEVQAGWASDIENSPRELLDDENRASEANEELSEMLPPLPQRAEPTLKERLVERERQARVETERARLKRQFALSSNGGAAVVEESDDMHASKENGSVTGTLGEGSSVAALPTDHPDEDDRKQLGYVMERFLSERGDVSAGEEKEDAKPKAETGVVMKRFLAEPFLVEQDGVVEDDEEGTKMSAEVGVVDPDTQVFVERGDVEDSNDLPAIPELHVSSTIDTHESMEAAGLPLRSYSTVTNNSLLETNTVDVDLPSQSARAGIPASVEEAKPKTQTGVVMKRFLAEPVLVEQDDVAEGHEENIERLGEVGLVDSQAEAFIERGGVEGNVLLPAVPELHVSNTVDTHELSMLEANDGSVRSYSTVTNNSLLESNTMDADLPTESAHPGIAISVDEPGLDGASSEPLSPSRDPGSSINSSQQSPLGEPRRFFRLTEAEIQEMAAIEEASIGNAPPSEREETFSESSLVGDLVGDLVGPRGVERIGDFSERTTTTALESLSVTSADGDESDRPSLLGIDRRSVDGIERASVSSHLAVSPGASSESSVSIAVCPPSVTAAEEPPVVLGPDDNVVVGNDLDGNTMLDMPLLDDNLSDDANNANALTLDRTAGMKGPLSFQENDSLDIEAAAVANAGVMNRQLRPGKVRLSPIMAPARMPFVGPSTPENGSGMKRSASMPDKARIMLEDFEFDRNSLDPVGGTPHSGGVDSYNDLPGDELWASPREMKMSPLRSGTEKVSGSERVRQAALDLRRDGETREGERNFAVTYGSTDLHGQDGVLRFRASPDESHSLELYGDPEKSSSETHPLMRFRGHGDATTLSHPGEDHPEIRHLVSNVFSSVRSDSTATVEAENNDSENYLMTNFLARGRCIADARHCSPVCPLRWFSC